MKVKQKMWSFLILFIGAILAIIGSAFLYRKEFQSDPDRISSGARPVFKNTWADPSGVNNVYPAQGDR